MSSRGSYSDGALMWRLFCPFLEHVLRAALDQEEFVKFVSELQYGSVKEVADILGRECRGKGW